MHDIMHDITRRSFAATSVAVIASLGFLTSCNEKVQDVASNTGRNSNNSTDSEKATITIGTLATEDILPLWVAKSEGLFEKAYLDAQIVMFQSATELIAGVASGEVDLAMTDILVAASIFASGTEIQMEWITLGTTSEQGRFGIMVGPNSDIHTLTDLANIPIGVGSNTILEYVINRLMEAAGIPENQLVIEELQKLPVRYQAMIDGTVKAAALPGTLLALGEANNCRLITDDTQGDNISQSVMISRSAYVANDVNSQQIERLEDVWDDATELINSNPEKYRKVLVSNANLPDAIADTYPISKYPTCQLPTAEMVNPVLNWMLKKRYLTVPLSYDETTGTFS